MNLNAAIIDQRLNSVCDVYGDADVSLQQLSAAFRRGDLIEKLEHLD